MKLTLSESWKRRVRNVRGRPLSPHRADAGDVNLRIQRVGHFIAVITGDLPPEFVDEPIRHHRHQAGLEAVAPVLAGVVDRFSPGLAGIFKIEVVTLQPRVVVLGVERVAAVENVIAPDKQRRRVVAAAFFAFEVAQHLRQRLSGRDVEAHHERHAQKVLLDSREEKGAVALDRAAKAAAKLILEVVQIASEGVR